MIKVASPVRWYWPGILCVPAVGLIAQQVWTFHGLSLNGSLSDQLRSAAGWSAWVASPFLLIGAGMAMAVWRRHRVSWWVAVVGGVATVLQGWLLIVLALSDSSTDPLAGLYQVLTPLLQLGTALPCAVAVLVLVLVTGRQPDRPASDGNVPGPHA